MCGFVGFSGRFSEWSLTQSLNNIAHRGPDDSGSFFDEDSKIGLGHRRLSIQDISKFGHQPMISLSENVIAYNGEVYNFKKMKLDLETKGYVFDSSSDTEVILYLYEEYGLDMFSMLEGIFAMAIWDRAKQELIIARDGLGVKPLYYGVSHKGVVFASEIKALSPLVDLSKMDVDVPSLNRYLAFLYCPGDGTPLKQVRKVPPGEFLIVKNGVISSRNRFHRLPLARGLKKSNLSCSKIVDQLDEKLRDAVHGQMVSDVPIGAFLSGGLDSSSIVYYASEVQPNIKCFTIQVDEKTTDGMENDLPYAERVAEHLGVDLSIISVDSERMAKGLESMVIQLDEPLADPAPLNVAFISELARSKDIKVLLSGSGGDDIFTGYRRHRALSVDQYVSMLPSPVLSYLEKITGKLDPNIVFFRRLAKLLNGASLKGDERIVNYFRWIKHKDLYPLFTSSFKNDLAADIAESTMYDFLGELPLSLSPLDRMLALEQRFFLADHNLNYTDKMAMASGIEVRVPLLDENLMQFVDTIPDNLKQRGKHGKWIFKKTMEKHLPKSVIYRSKTGFGGPLRSWLNFELRELRENLLSPQSLRHRGIFEPVAVSSSIERNNRNDIDAAYTILSLMCIEIWFRHFVDDAPSLSGV